MEFRLVYRGHLPPAKHAKAGDKQLIRKHFHPQLKEFWRRHFQLNSMLTLEEKGRPKVENLADQYAYFGFRFLPLVNRFFQYTCSLDILFLRRDVPGNLFDKFGDVDNRLKTLIDGLKMPKVKAELGDEYRKPSPDEDPFYCLLEDDILVTDFNVTTDTLLTPLESDEAERDVVAIIQVKTRAVGYNYEL